MKKVGEMKKGITNKASEKRISKIHWPTKPIKWYEGEILGSGVLHVVGAGRFRCFQSGEMVPDLGVVTPQELVGSSGYVDVIGFALGSFLSQKLVDGFILWRQSEIDAHDIEQCFAEIWRATFGGFVAAAVFLAGLVWHRINSGEGHEGLLASEARDIANLRHELRPEGFAYGVHLHHNRILRQLRRQFVHLSAVDFY